MRVRVALRTANLLAVMVLIGPGASRAFAQVRPTPGTIDGVVTDTNLVVLTGATASILGSAIQVITGVNGRFRIVGLPAGEHVLVVRHLGYAPTSTVIQVAGGDTLRLSFALERVVNALDTVVVAGKRLSFKMTEFENRRRFGFGQFMTQAEIEKRNSTMTADLLRTFQSVSVVPGKIFEDVAVNLRSRCSFKLFVDGIAQSTNNLADLPLPKELAGIEVYLGPATIPPQYKGSFCGVMLFWTRDGR